MPWRTPREFISEGGDSNGEESKGREEEGREEAVAAASSRNGVKPFWSSL
jgi:hypothetical protein